MQEDCSGFELADVIRGLEMLIGREHVSDEYVRFRIELVRAQTSIRDALGGSAAWPDVRPSERDHVWPLDSDQVPLDRALLGKLLRAVQAALGPRDRRIEEVDRLSAAAREKPELLERLAGKAAFGPDEDLLGSVGHRLRISCEALVFFGRMLGAPFVSEAVRRLKECFPQTAAASGGCPWCGSPPGLAALGRREEAEGNRVMFCSLCGQRWEFDRLKCPFCGSREALGVISLESGGPCCVETCDRCKGYLKTVDERKLPEHHTIVPLVETTATLYLDMIAEREGYARGLPYAALH